MFVRSVIRPCEWWARIGSTVASVNGISRDRLAEGRVLLPAVNDLLRILGVVLSHEGELVGLFGFGLLTGLLQEGVLAGFVRAQCREF